MGQLMSQGKHLLCPGIPAVDKDQRRKWISQGKTAKLLHIQGATSIAAHHAADHDQYPSLLDLRDEAVQSFGPVWQLLSLSQIETSGPGDPGCYPRHLVRHRGGTNKGSRLHAMQALIVPVPGLAPLAEVDGIQEIGTRTGQPRPGQRAKVRNRQWLFGWAREKKQTDGGMGGVGKGFQLLQGGRMLPPSQSFSFGNFSANAPALTPARSSAQWDRSGLTATRVFMLPP